MVLAHLNHRLVQMSLRLLRAEVWSLEGRKRLHRVTARLVPDTVLHHLAVVAHARLVVIGGDSQRLHEEIITAGGPDPGGTVRPVLVAQGDARRSLCRHGPRSLGAVEEETVPALAEHRGTAGIRPSKPGPRTGRTGMKKLLADRADKEVSDITAILTELRRAIQEQLDDPDYRENYLPGFAPAEQEQFERNVDALRRRLEEIPGEIEKETEAIRARFADPQPRMFPVAVTFLVPARLAR